MRTLLIIIGIWFLWKLLHQAVQRNKGKIVCRNCGSCTRPKVVSPRNLFVEILLWFTALIPGVIYTLWCSHETYEVCDKCGSRDIVPEDSPVGRSLSGNMVDITPISEQTNTGSKWK